jgi:23S rRNA (adenine2030-N6)-methyltransferase
LANIAMNYRHSFHAGNFADVLKHLILVRVLLHLLKKDSAFRVIETHSGTGMYDLENNEASRTNEWRDGIGRLIDRPFAGEAATLLEPYLSLIRSENFNEKLRYYPGSPSIALKLCRERDRLIFCELHPEDYNALRRNLGGDKRAKAIEINGWTALSAYLPPKERRGLVLIDPAFEEAQEFEHIAAGLADAYSRWETGIYLLWYPIKDEADSRSLERQIVDLKIPKTLRIELVISPVRTKAPLAACGMIIINPPWTLESELKSLLPPLVERLGQRGEGRYRLDWITR